MTLRIAVGGISHETNTFATATFGQTQLEAFTVLRGEEWFLMRGTQTFGGGIIDAAEGLGAELLPTLWAFAEPSGTISRDAYIALRDELVEGVRALGQVDAVVLELHGAGVADGEPDIESDIARAVRAVVGPSVPIVAPLDLHGNVTDAMAADIDLMFGEHFYPHTDMHDRGHEAVMAIPGLAAGTLRPVTHVEHVPMLLPTSTTGAFPASEINERCWRAEERPGVIDCTFFHGFPYTDTPTVGCHIVVTTDGDRELAASIGREIGSWLWAHRDAFRADTHTPADAVKLALEADAGPVVINDTADNTGGGAPGDATHLLRAMVEADLQSACFGYVFDPDVVRQAIAAGVGSQVVVELGGKHDDLHGSPVTIEATVRAITDGVITLSGPMLTGAQQRLGPMVRLAAGGLDIIVGSARSQTFDTEVFTSNGIDVTRYDIVALKSSHHFRAAYQPIAAQILTADSPGFTTLDTSVFPRRHAPGPMWPLDPGATYRGAEA